MQGELHFLSRWIWVREQQAYDFSREIVSSSIEHKERAQIPEPGIVPLKPKDLMWEERSRHSQTYPRQCKSCILSVPNPGEKKRSRVLFHSKELTHFQYIRIWLDFMYSIQTPEVRSCLTGSIQKPLHLDDRSVQHEGRGQAEQVWAGESKSPGLWTRKHNSCIIDLDTSKSCRVDDGKISREGKKR